MATGVLPGTKGLIQPYGAPHGVLSLSGTPGGIAPGLANSSPTYLAEHLARVFGTEEDPVNCSFYFKVGACRAGDKCSKKHNHPIISQTLLMTNMYPVPQEAIAIANEEFWDDEVYDRAQKHCEGFYEDVVVTLASYGEIEEVIVVENTMPYMLGNVYVKYRFEEDAAKALTGLTGRYYMGKLISAEYAPVTDFREARCRAHHETRCSRLGCCRFLHFKHIPKAVKRRVAREMYRDNPDFGGRSRSRRRQDANAIEDGKGKGKKGPPMGPMGPMGGLPPALAIHDTGRGRGQDMYNPEDMYDPEQPPRRKRFKENTDLMIQDAPRSRQNGQEYDPEALECDPEERPRRRRMRDPQEYDPEAMEDDPEGVVEQPRRRRRRRTQAAEHEGQEGEEEYGERPRRRVAKVDESEL